MARATAKRSCRSNRYFRVGYNGRQRPLNKDLILAMVRTKKHGQGHIEIQVIRVIPPGKQPAAADREAQLRWFDQATERHRRRRSSKTRQPRDRGWRREDLYGRGRSH
ncbi:hypothetical protein SBA6_1000003 [Candidatus Sulfopaludibacter sp. SbA6]|nr:hypothetical protein SBA6_1000003 [Candidatus Sulfopaludibacter sp. SbA6]